jgi:hypothetical protein
MSFDNYHLIEVIFESVEESHSFISRSHSFERKSLSHSSSAPFCVHNSLCCALALNEVVGKIGSELDLTSIFTPPHLMTFQVMKEKENERVSELERESERDRVCVCVREREKQSVSERESERVCGEMITMKMKLSEKLMRKNKRGMKIRKF